MTYFRRGIITATEQGSGTIRELTSWGTQQGNDISFSFDDVRFLDADYIHRVLSFGPRYQGQDNTTLVTLRDPVVGDIVMYDCRYTDGVLHVTNWTHEVHYKETEDKLPRCAIKDCSKVSRPHRYYCAHHACIEDELDEDDDWDNEDPLAGDVEPTGGFYEPLMHPWYAHRLEVMRQHGDYTG